MDIYWTIMCGACLLIGFAAGYFECKLRQAPKNENIKMRASDNPEDETLPWMMRKQAD